MFPIPFASTESFSLPWFLVITGRSFDARLKDVLCTQQHVTCNMCVTCNIEYHATSNVEAFFRFSGDFATILSLGLGADRTEELKGGEGEKERVHSLSTCDGICGRVF